MTGIGKWVTRFRCKLFGHNWIHYYPTSSVCFRCGERVYAIDRQRELIEQ